MDHPGAFPSSFYLCRCDKESFPLGVSASPAPGRSREPQLEAQGPQAPQAPSRKGNHLALGMALMGQKMSKRFNEDLALQEVFDLFDSGVRRSQYVL